MFPRTGRNFSRGYHGDFIFGCGRVVSFWHCINFLRTFLRLALLHHMQMMYLIHKIDDYGRLSVMSHRVSLSSLFLMVLLSSC